MRKLLEDYWSIPDPIDEELEAVQVSNIRGLVDFCDH